MFKKEKKPPELSITPGPHKNTMEMVEIVGMPIAEKLQEERLNHPMWVGRFLKEVITHEILWLHSPSMVEVIQDSLADMKAAKTSKVLDCESPGEDISENKQLAMRNIIADIINIETALGDYLKKV